MKKKIQIYAPLTKEGGREIETGFIASILSEKYSVKITSLGNFYKNSSIHNIINKNIVISSVNKKVYEKTRHYKLIIDVFSFLKKNTNPNHFRGSNSTLKIIFKIENKKIKILEEEIKKTNLVFICAQLSTNYVKQIIRIAKENNIPTIFRTTGTIKINKKNFSWCKDVSIFVHHSQKNTNILNKEITHNYIIIDQCAIEENKILNTVKPSKSIKTFCVLSRLSSEKQIDKVILAFKAIAEELDFLLIFGSGPEEKFLKKIAKNNKRIIFKGSIPNSNIHTVFNQIDCFIISSSEEAGPITGIEAMAAGKIIISTRVGAMEERFGGLCFFYNGSVEDLKQKMLEVKNTNSQDLEIINKKMKDLYIKNYSLDKITKKYLNVISEFI